MKNRPGFLLMVAALLAGLAAPADAQTLGDAARLEAERRSRVTGTAKVVTNADLEGAPFLRGVPVKIGDLKPANPAEGVQATLPPKPSDAQAAQAGEQAALPKVRQKRDEEHWRERAKLIRDRLDRLRSDAAAIEERLGTLRTELQSASGSQAAGLTKEIEQAGQDLARFQNELRLIQDEWTAFEERARQAKVPPSWIHG